MADEPLTPPAGAEVLAARQTYPGLAPDRDLPDDTQQRTLRCWDVSGGTWGGCVYDVDRIIEVLEAGKKALAAQQ